ncbi:NAD(P)H-dependent oxidoreductase subunit E [bacterium]|nr:NAD(P)H-dependent oxidoreductase subunit E [bacterium]MBU1985374.1 NAD(P)H-dependent oxidoreductase subunit E [bacterium]
MQISDTLRKKAEEIFFRFPPEHREAALVPLMFEAQRELGCITPDTERWLAETVGVSLVKVREVLSFYCMFRTAPAGKFLIMLCHNISCCLAGAENLQQHLESKLGIRNGETTSDGVFTLKYAECLGGCSWAPMMLINENQYYQLTVEKLDRIIESYRKGQPILPEEPTPLLGNVGEPAPA